MKALYNGNISQINWNTLSVNNTSNPVSSQYEYTYDALNRITAATSDASGNYNVSGITYDKNGNIITLTRNGWQNSSSYANMDILSYEYHQNTNQLKNVNDTGNANYGFKDGSELATEYTYDANGNILTDANKNITSVEYNHLNMPTKITVTGANAGVLQYKYSADGVKLRKIKTQGVTSTTTDYANGYTYVNNELQYFPTLEGYVTKDNTGFKYVYQYKDHLGNVRLSYTDNNNDGIIQTGSNTEIIEESNYYPFGLKQKGYNEFYNPIGNATAQKLGYLGEELQEDLGLDLVDFTTRFYNPALGRFITIDPVAGVTESLSGYHYSYNNPIFFKDPTGLTGEGPDHIATKYIDERGNVLLDTDDGSDMVVTVTDENAEEFWNIIKQTMNDDTDTDSKEWNFKMKSWLLGTEWNQAKENTYSWWNNEESQRLAALYAQTGDINYLYAASWEHGNVYRKDPLAWAAGIAGGLYGVALLNSGQGIIYLRTDRTGNLKPYVGQAKNEARYLARQKEHARAHPNSDFSFKKIDNGSATGNFPTTLDKAEQKALNKLGGPTNKSNPNGGTSNKKNVIKQNKKK